jgi:hypothetical protein
MTDTTATPKTRESKDHPTWEALKKKVPRLDAKLNKIISTTFPSNSFKYIFSSPIFFISTIPTTQSLVPATIPPNQVGVVQDIQRTLKAELALNNQESIFIVEQAMSRQLQNYIFTISDEPYLITTVRERSFYGIYFYEKDINTCYCDDQIA